MMLLWASADPEGAARGPSLTHRESAGTRRRHSPAFLDANAVRCRVAFTSAHAVLAPAAPCRRPAHRHAAAVTAPAGIVRELRESSRPFQPARAFACTRMRRQVSNEAAIPPPSRLRSAASRALPRPLSRHILADSKRRGRAVWPALYANVAVRLSSPTLPLRPCAATRGRWLSPVQSRRLSGP